MLNISINICIQGNLTLEIIINILPVIGGVCFPLPPGFFPALFFGAGSAKRRLMYLMI